jgi:hypothetical protein
MICDEGLYAVKVDVPERLRVEYKGAMYYPVGYQLAFRKDGSVIHTAILHDLNANCMAYVPLQDVK